MRLQIVIDSASTAEMRELQQAYHEAASEESMTVAYQPFGTAIEVGVNGPEKWTAKTPMLPENIATTVMAIYSDRLRAIRNEL